MHACPPLSYLSITQALAGGRMLRMRVAFHVRSPLFRRGNTPHFCTAYVIQKGGGRGSKIICKAYRNPWVDWSLCSNRDESRGARLPPLFYWALFLIFRG